MEKDRTTVSTGKAARLCGVKPDTVLKWIKAEKISATKTLGGHYRIHSESLFPFLSESIDCTKTAPAETSIRCWEFCSGNGTIKADCLQCIVFRSDAENCHVLATLGKNGGFQGVYCKVTCESCDYYKFKQKSKTKVLVITNNENYIEKLKVNGGQMIEFIFSCCGYTACLAIQESYPDIILIDDSINSIEAVELCNHICQDKRVNNTRVFLTSQQSDTHTVLAQASTSKNFHTLQEFLDNRG